MLLGTQHSMTDQLRWRLSLATTLRTELAVLSQHDYLWNSLYCRLLAFTSAQMTVVGTEVCIGHVLGILSRNAPREPLCLYLDHAQDSSVSNTSSASHAHGCCPNSYFIVNERLLLVGEDKVNSNEVPLAYGNAMKDNVLSRVVACCVVLACCTWC